MENSEKKIRLFPKPNRETVFALAASAIFLAGRAADGFFGDTINPEDNAPQLEQTTSNHSGSMAPLDVLPTEPTTTKNDIASIAGYVLRMP